MDHDDIVDHMQRYWNINFKRSKKNDENNQGKNKRKDGEDQNNKEKEANPKRQRRGGQRGNKNQGKGDTNNGGRSNCSIAATKIIATIGRGATLIRREDLVDLTLKPQGNSTRMRQRGQTFGTGTSTRSGKMRGVAIPMITKGAAADADMEADAVAVVVDTTAAVAAEEEDMVAAAIKGADTMVGVKTTIKATTRTRIKEINKVRDTTTMSRGTIRNTKLRQLGHLNLAHLKINLGSPTTTWGLQGRDHYLHKRYPVTTSTCALQGGNLVQEGIREMTSLWVPTIQLLSKTSS